MNKAYRKKSKLLHPDKVKRAFIANSSRDKARAKTAQQGVHVAKPPSKREVDAAIKEAHDRSARLNTIATILRGPARERYDHFLKNGFPKWKGTGYYYSRYRPGLASVLIGLALVFGGGAHYAALVLSWKRQREFVYRYIRQARRAAWGDEIGIPGLNSADSTASVPNAPEDGDAGAMSVNRRQKRMMDKESKKENKKGNKTASSSRSAGAATAASTPATAGPSGERKRVIAENGKVLIVDSAGDVFLEEETEDGEKQEFLLDINELQRPTIRDTVLYRLPGWAFGKIVGGFKQTDDAAFSEEEERSPEELDSSVSASSSAPTSNGVSSRRKGKRSQRS